MQIVPNAAAVLSPECQNCQRALNQIFITLNKKKIKKKTASSKTKAPNPLQKLDSQTFKKLLYVNKLMSKF